MYTFKSIIINREDEDDKYLMFLLLIEEPSLESTSPDISPSGIFYPVYSFCCKLTLFLIRRTNNSISFTITIIRSKIKVSLFIYRTFYNK